jgi:hypothetical protein
MSRWGARLNHMKAVILRRLAQPCPLAGEASRGYEVSKQIGLERMIYLTRIESLT